MRPKEESWRLNIISIPPAFVKPLFYRTEKTFTGARYAPFLLLFLPRGSKIEEEENLLVEARAKKQAIEAEKLTADNIYKVLIYFEKLYGVMNDVERRRFIEALISEIQIFPERQPNGQWLKSIKFKLPIIGENMELSLDNDKYVETVCLLSRK